MESTPFGSKLLICGELVEPVNPALLLVMSEPVAATAKRLDLASIRSFFIVNRREVSEAREQFVTVREKFKEAWEIIKKVDSRITNVEANIHSLGERVGYSAALEEAEPNHPDVLAGWFVEEARTPARPVSHGGRRPQPVGNPPQPKWSGQPKKPTSGPDEEIAKLVDEVRAEYALECKPSKVGANDPVGSDDEGSGPRGFGKWAEAMADLTEIEGVDEALARREEFGIVSLAQPNTPSKSLDSQDGSGEEYDADDYDEGGGESEEEWGQWTGLPGDEPVAGWTRKVHWADDFEDRFDDGSPCIWVPKRRRKVKSEPNDSDVELPDAGSLDADRPSGSLITDLLGR